MADDVAVPRPQAVKHVPCEVYSRIVGYLRPVQAWNEGKRQEFSERQTYNMERCLAPGEDVEAAQHTKDG